ncbi:hypothetical protein EOS_03390 [Caballeronia mineralivorans PML1(12)]|uniref:Uncharacterized protein n=1 Tax=Caballeronia mineralivorans PML1(12) TaxID=908627 RepID=A0A0J1D4X2_9BURK|nr:hypothetical protein [Caballeronia mineralivorans]KLU27666.1 hypothetical protein EOS_03390 [Caballeronia mineralivorans PML1(12)]
MRYESSNYEDYDSHPFETEDDAGQRVANEEARIERKQRDASAEMVRDYLSVQLENNAWAAAAHAQGIGREPQQHMSPLDQALRHRRPSRRDYR